MHIYNYFQSRSVILHQHVLVTTVTIIRVVYCKNTISIQITVQKCTILHFIYTSNVTPIGFIIKFFTITRVVPKVMSNFILHAKCEQQTKESAVVDGTSCCVILECLVTSIACITWPVSLLTKWPTKICRSASVLSSNSLWKRKFLLQKFTRSFSVPMEVCAWLRAVFADGWNILKMGKRASNMNLGAVALEQAPLNATRREWMRSFKMTGVWLWTQ